ncbi:alpha-L-arabinofuranosidase C-terminal domain-containing protein [Dysgonomonas macrotermitis]|uniref:non-reducing end alpha-L-arabinofuranosidase n=1 Tax=Dysgonomonas macrotermitis TaxID=1346286 RepID=A0A1M5A0S0_9BACT|nr:alpha-L-arabinofuranosidase C-terminal domain-containing protein [Dysgonomonas macrotermitis]SHF23858.1 Alpha-L-arabinofuranosidase C-terminus [Dysgonomonas macrotermitis]
MRKILFFITALVLFIMPSIIMAAVSETKDEPRKAYIFAYATTKNQGHNGLHFAWSIDGENWHPIGPEHSYMKSDYGPWGSQKRMLTPFLFQSKDGMWHCIWSLNEKDDVFAHASSVDLVNWKRQSYPVALKGSNCLLPQISLGRSGANYIVSWATETPSGKQVYSRSTKDFKNYTDANSVGDELSDERQTVIINAVPELGTIYQVDWETVDRLIKAQQVSAYRASLHGELAKDDVTRFASLKPVDATIIIDKSKQKKISELLIGAFFEDISYAADGGLYAELVQNRGFEYAPSDRAGREPEWNSKKAWSVSGTGMEFDIDTISPVHVNNKHYAVLGITTSGAALVNEGFDGIAVKRGDKYYFTAFTKVLDGKGGKITIRLKDKEGKILGETFIKAASKDWKKQEAVLLAKGTSASALLEVMPEFTGKLALDMISLFPEKTFKGHRNGLRTDLAQVIADIHPRFVRFPGGCVAHGDGLHNIYNWKNTIGPLEERIPQGSIWRYHQSMGLGYFEYFQYCEDMGAEPLPVIAAGVPCQNSGTGRAGQQGGIPMEQMGQYVQDILDLIEYANGDIKTTWGKKRAEAGHPKPFNLKYIGIGNEDLITDVFEERFTMIYNAIKEKHPEITVIGTVGPFSEGTDYVEGWDIATKLGVPMVDEHYYQPPGWFIHNQDYYDRYDRSKSKVYLGEYASHVPGRHNNMETALSEALYLTSVERNGDVVSLSSYAPLLAKEGRTNWNPDLIYFNNTEVKLTTGYYVQQLYGQNSGDYYLPSAITLSNEQNNVKLRIGKSVVRDSRTNDVIIKLVNMLPVPVNAKIDLGDIAISDTNAVKTVLKGTPDDKTAKPIVSSCTVSKEFSDELPPYSFTVIRIKVQ